MKLNLFKTVGRLRRHFPLLLAGVFLVPLAGLATDSIYINTGFINNGNIPNVDATNFFNSGTWNIGVLSVPYTTSHTLNYTNTGTMNSSVGWEFDYGPLPLIGGRGWSSSFVNNSASATIYAIDGTVANPPGTLNRATASYLLVSATNIVNKGVLQADPNGQIFLTGGTVNLSRSQVLISGTLVNSGFISGTNFALDSGLYAEDWAQTNAPARNMSPGVSIPSLNVTTLWDGTTAAAPLYAVQNNCSTNFMFGTNISFQATVSDSLDNLSVPTNEVRQAVFVLTTDPNISAQIRFTPSSMESNGFQTAAVKLSATLTNPFTLGLFTNTIYVVDTLGSETNFGYYVDTNISSFFNCSGKLYQPANYIVSRSQPTVSQTGLLAFSDGTPGAGTPAASFFNLPNYILHSVSNAYSAYGVFVDDLATDPAAANPTNLPGVIRISADNLDLTRTWLGAQGGIFIQTSNLLGSAGAIVDCRNLNYFLGSTTGFLNLTNVAKQFVNRLRGPINMYSATWTNLQPGMSGTNVVTNSVGFSVLLVDASGLSTTIPVQVQSLVMHSTNTTISDSLIVAQSMSIDGQILTLLGALVLDSQLVDWTSAIAPNLLYFTNQGNLFIGNNAHFGDDTAVPYTEFVNQGISSNFPGIIWSGSQTINSRDIRITNGINYTYVGDFTASAGSIQITGPPVSHYFVFLGGYIPIPPDSIYSAGNVNLTAGSLLIDPAVIYAGGTLNLNVTNSLSDNGTADILVCNNGFNLGIKPQTGDLLGSTLYSIASGNNAVVDSTWAGEDRGPIYAGFNNNVALGALVLSAQNYLPQFTPLFVFSKASTTSNAMYVMTLDLSQVTSIPANLANMIQINPGMKIYVSQVILGFTPPGGQSPLAYVQSQFPGQIIAASTTPPAGITISGGLYQAGGHFVLTWNATSGATYSVLRTNTIGSSAANWPAIVTGYPTGGAAGGPLSYTDTTATATPAFYKVRSP